MTFMAQMPQNMIFCRRDYIFLSVCIQSSWVSEKCNPENFIALINYASYTGQSRNEDVTSQTNVIVKPLMIVCCKLEIKLMTRDKLFFCNQAEFFNNGEDVVASEFVLYSRPFLTCDNLKYC